MALIEIGAVTLTEPVPQALWGRNIELPKSGSKIDGHMIDLMGWVLGRESQAVAIEVVYDGEVVKRTPITIERSDVAAFYTNVANAEQSGFRVSFSVQGIIDLQLLVQVVLHDQRRIPLGVIEARRRWRASDYSVGAALVSVVLTCHNQAHLLPEAIDSVLAQTYPHFELLIVDDHSADNALAVAARYPGVRCLPSEQPGRAAAWNTGLRHSNGSYLVFLEPTERLHPQALACGLRALSEHPDCALAIGRARETGRTGAPHPTQQPPLPTRDHYLALLRHNFIQEPASVMYRRAVFESVRGFDPEMSPVEDYDLYLRVARNYPLYYSDDIVLEQPDSDQVRTGVSLQEASMRLMALRAQWKHVKHSPRYRDAYTGGYQAAQAAYGWQIAQEAREFLRSGAWRLALYRIWMLLRTYPYGLLYLFRDHSGQSDDLEEGGRSSIESSPSNAFVTTKQYQNDTES